MGRQKRGVSTHFFRPSGTFPFHDRKPSTEVLGYFLPPSGLGHGEHLRVPLITGSEAGQRAVHFVLRRQSASGDGAFARTGYARIFVILPAGLRRHSRAFRGFASPGFFSVTNVGLAPHCRAHALKFSP